MQRDENFQPVKSVDAFISSAVILSLIRFMFALLFVSMNAG